MNFPTYQYFNFFENPHNVIDIANKLSYEKEVIDGRVPYPGMRSEPLFEAEPNLFQYVCHKTMQMFYNTQEMKDVKWVAKSTFQKITAEDTFEGEGWPHRDIESMLTSIVYLSPQNTGAGTTIYYPKSEAYKNTDNARYKKFSGEEVDKEYYMNQFDENMKKFEVAASFNSIFNSCVCFDGGYVHGANLKVPKGEERLTLITFFYKIVAPRFPLGEVRKGK